MDDEARDLLEKVLGVAEKILGVAEGLASELDRYRELLPEPGSVKARMLRRKVASSAVDQWTGI